MKADGEPVAAPGHFLDELASLPDEELVHVGSVRKCIEEAVRREHERERKPESMHDIVERVDERARQSPPHDAAPCAKCRDLGYHDTPSISVYGGSVRLPCDCIIGVRYALVGMTEQRDRALVAASRARSAARFRSA